MLTTVLTALLFLLPSHTIHNFDKQLTSGDSMVVIAPPPGKTWKVHAASFVIGKPIPGTSATVFIEQMPYGTGLCTNLIRVDSGRHSWVPIVGGYVATGDSALRGQDAPIELTHPDRLVIALTGLSNDPLFGNVKSWTRATIEEVIQP